MKNSSPKHELNIITLFVVVSVAFVLLISAVSIYSINTVHKITEDIYTHPLKVSNAALNIQKGVLKIHRDMKDIVLPADKVQLQRLIKQVDKEEQNVYKYFAVVKTKILGKKGLELEEKTYKLFKQWKNIRDQVIQLVQHKKFHEAIAITQNRGAKHVVKLENATMALYHYADAKAAVLKGKAHQTFKKFHTLDMVLLFLTIFFLLLFFFYIRNRIHSYMKIIRENEKELAEINEQYQLATEGTNDGLWDWNIKEGTVYFSPRWKEMLGYRDDELLNEFESWESRVHPDDLEMAEKAIEHAHTDPKVIYNIVHRLRHKNGSWIWILDRGQTIFDADGKAVRMIGFHTDITKQKELEEELCEAKNQFETFMNFLPANVYITENHEILYANRAANTFFGRKTLVGLQIEDVIPLKKAQELNRAFDKALQNGSVEEITQLINIQGEETIRHQLIFSMQKGESKKVGLISLDITKEKHKEQELREKEELMIAQSRHAAMGEMISMIAHQWRQPISVIAMDANNIQADIELNMLDSNELLQTSQDILQQTLELSKTIDDFREFFRPNQSPEETLLKNIIDDALGIVGKSLQNNDIKLFVDIDSSIKITTFSRELMQVLINILKNAKEILLEQKEDEEKKIVMHSKSEKENLILTICDNGGGIREDIIEKVFDPYFTTKDEKDGTGLGLYMSKIIVQKHLNGAIIASDTDEGACFEIKLPYNLYEAKKREGEDIDNG